MQKHLFFYECLSKINGEPYDFSDLKGYERGPVFGNVYAENTYNRDPFRASCLQCAKRARINESRAEQALFLTKIFGNGLSEFTHQFDIWSKKKDRIMSGEKQVPLEDKDFSAHDAQLFVEIQKAYPKEYIDAVTVHQDYGMAFILPRGKDLTEEQWDVLCEIAQDPETQSPIYVDVDENGGLLID